jgi:hypothetical protein
MPEEATQRFTGAYAPADGADRGLDRLRAAAARAHADDGGDSVVGMSRSARLRAAAFVAAVMVTLRAGRHATALGYLTPEAGAGYALGVIGSAIMLLLLLYPLRKRWRALQRWGAVRNWFRIHMILGIIGPLCIALHCGMRPGAANSRIALVAMLLVVASGIVGRYLYAQIHHGLYGSRATLVELSLELATSRNRLVEDKLLTPALRQRLLHLGESVDSHPHGVLVSGLQVLGMSVRSRVLGSRLFVRLLAAGWHEERSPLGATRAARIRVSEYLGSVRKLAGFAFYERVFALWHMLHVPLFVLLLISGIVHVVAVHRY